MEKVTLIIEKEKGGFRPLEIDQEQKHRLTINTNGAVWFTGYGLNTALDWQFKAIRKCRSRIDQGKVDVILNLVEKVFDEMHGMIEPWDCDAERDVLTLKYENGMKRKIQLMEEYHPILTELYNEIRRVTCINNLLKFSYEFCGE